MKIAVLAPPYLPIPPNGYGGVERVVYHVTQGLVQKGHEVTLFASGDSKTSARLVSTFPTAIGNSGEMKKTSLGAVYPLLQYVDCFRRSAEFDIIHNHGEYLSMFLAEFSSVPVVHTIHSSLAEGPVTEKKAVLNRFSNHNFVSISENQRLPLPQINWVSTIYNGVDPTLYPYVENPQNYLLWMGRITQKKGPLDAIEVAKRTGIKLKLVGTVDPVENSFFEEKVKPLIDGVNVELIGELHGGEQAALYGNALATLYPISWHEPFGLVMTESMTCGTPVIAYNMGSVPEIIEDGVSGYIVSSGPAARVSQESLQSSSNDTHSATGSHYQGASEAHLGSPSLASPVVIKQSGIDGLVEAVGRIKEIQRAACRKRVEERFTVEKMVDGYDSVFTKIVNSK